MRQAQVHIAYSQYNVIGGEPDGEDSADLPGLAHRVGPRWVVVISGAEDGEITVEAESVAGPPPVEEGWDLIGELDVLVSDDEGLKVRDWAGPAHPEIGDLASRGNGLYRLRIHMRGRYNGNIDDPTTERHRIIVWPVESEAEPTFLTEMDAHGRAILNPPPH